MQVFYFSLHHDVENLGNHALYARGFNVQIFKKMEQLAQACMSQLNSPIIWKCGIRNAKNFAWSEFAVIDVDDGPCLGDAMVNFKEYEHIIGTTKSHRKLKGNKIADRYRIFLPLVRRVTIGEEYAAINKYFALRHGGDLQAVGPHMAFMPLREIVSYSRNGKKMPIPDIETEKKFVRRPRVEIDTTSSVSRIIPNYIQRWLRFGVAPGERNITCFKAACGLLKVGFREDEILNLLLDSAIPVDRSSRVESEIRSTVRNALRTK